MCRSKEKKNVIIIYFTLASSDWSWEAGAPYAYWLLGRSVSMTTASYLWSLFPAFFVECNIIWCGIIIQFQICCPTDVSSSLPLAYPQLTSSRGIFGENLDAVPKMLSNGQNTGMISMLLYSYKFKEQPEIQHHLSQIQYTGE